MNILKNLEVVFVLALAAVSVASLVLDRLPAAEAAKRPVPVARNIATPTSMAVVIIKAPRAQAGN